MVKIITVNVNGIRAAAKKGLFAYLVQENADIVCLQEIKAQEAQLDRSFYPEGYHCYYHYAQKKGYSGVAILTKQPPDKLSQKTPWQWVDEEGRYLQADFARFSIISLYIPSGSSKQARQDLKMQFLLRDFTPHLKYLTQAGKNYIICGDFNMVHKRIDIKNFNGNKNRSGCLPEERAWMGDLFNKIGFVDAFRVCNQQPQQYTWWSNRGEAWANNTGWRIDYQITSPAIKNTIKSAHIYKKRRFSDHAPLVVEYQL